MATHDRDLASARRWVVVVLVAGVSTATACAQFRSPETAGNNVQRLFADLVEQEYDSGYERLCGEVKKSVTSEEFERSRGSAVSPMLTASGEYGTDVVSIPDHETLEDEISEAWQEYVALPSDPPTREGGLAEESRWRITSVREDGAWRVCRFERILPR